jgi:hypothetical protein
VLYPLATLWVVVVTGNHFIIDGVVAYILLAAAAAITCIFPSQRPVRWSRNKAKAEPFPGGSEAPRPSDETQAVSP